MKIYRCLIPLFFFAMAFTGHCQGIENISSDSKYENEYNRDQEIAGYNSKMRSTNLQNKLSFNPSSAATDTSNLDWWNDAVFYEIFVRSFYDSDDDGVGDFNGITEKLDYLNDGNPNTTSDLGITGIWLMPIHESPSYHGYDVIDYLSVNSDYGTMDDFKNLVSEAHKRGIKIIIDFVLNHSSAQHPWFMESSSNPNSLKRDYYKWETSNPAYLGPWGQQVWHNLNGNYYYGIFWDQMPDLNYENQEMKEAMFSASDFWLEDVGIDGFRLDAVLYIYEEEGLLKNHPKTFEFFEDFNARVKSKNPQAFSVGEAWEPSFEIIPYVIDDRLDFCFEFDLAESILGACNSGYAKQLEVTLDYAVKNFPYYQFAPFLGNHDKDRILNSFALSEEKNKAASSILLTIPGIPFLYYGEEIGMLGTKPDPDIRKPMPWSDEKWGGFTDWFPWRNVPENYLTNNVKTQDEDANSLLNHYRKMIQLRNRQKALRKGSIEILTQDETKVLAFTRKSGDEEFLILVNTSLREAEIKDFDLSKYLNLDDLPFAFDHYSQTIIENISDISGRINTMSLEPYQTMVIQFLDKLPSPSNDLKIFPNPSASKVFIALENTQGNTAKINYQISDLKGKKVQKGSLESNVINAEIDMSELRIGMYIIEIEINGNRKYSKIIKN